VLPRARTALAVVTAALVWAAASLIVMGGAPVGPPGPVTAFAVLACALVAVRLAARIAVPVPTDPHGAAWAGHPARRRPGGDLPRQQHPDSPGRARPRAPGLR